MFNFKHLLQFKPEDLILNNEETLTVLKFIFKPTHHELIDSLPMTEHLRGFAQGLLVEAIDASYAVGFLRALIESAANPTHSAVKIIKKFGRKAATHWFKHATVHDLGDVRIYDFIRDRVGLGFKSQLELFLTGTNLDRPAIANLDYKPPFCGPRKTWG